ncbi:AAA family ATPase [Chondromyces apiculatus]|uniref:Cell division protein FtsH n=1 Tax=Chondromyces apiculatus DSM 436 TaxID=1192034 RepID=A0A017T0N1_9BACT|nr:ATP-binding protein [Chondromyces apiculatus]EYF02819.1 Cell division protein FtsH [Chondromyces apiculatus DSM 436]
MATAEQLKALLKSYSENDEERFYAVAMQVAAHAARQGHGKLAQEMRELIDASKAKGPKSQRGERAPVPVVQPRGELAGLLSVSYPKTRLADMVLEPTLRARLERILLEQRQREKLLTHGLAPRRKILLVGPPGTGKTLTARALAGELSQPLFAVLLDGLITKFMGETAAKLRVVFDALQRTRGVYLFDEFDALGSQRTSPKDVGEIRRVLNSFLQFLEQDESESLIIAATSHVELLDRALFRRFDDILEYSLPDEAQAEQLLRARLAMLDTRRVTWKQVLEATRGLSYAEIVRACEDAAKDVVLSDSDEVTTRGVLDALEARRGRQP